MEVNIEFSATSEGSFSNTFLCFKEGNLDRKVRLEIHEFESIHDFTKDTTSLSFDFFLISAIVYAVDDLFSREQFSINGWTRDIKVNFPVYHPSQWDSVKSTFEESLSFLTGDHWDISFYDIGSTNLFVERNKRRKNAIPRYNKDDYSFASLFSGGLDSLIGVINELNNLPKTKRCLLISHYDGAYNGPMGDQNKILKKFRNLYGHTIDHLRCRIGLKNIEDTDYEIKRDANQRSRSLLFLAFGTYILNSVPNVNTLQLPENGTISLNHPLTPSRSSSLSTRTTHPHFVKNVERILNALGLQIDFNNHFYFKTKAEMVRECLNTDALKKTFSESASCGKRRPQPKWDVKGAKQCGTCMPCIYRRAALHQLNLDNEVYGKDLLKKTNPLNASADMPALFDYLKAPLQIEEIKRNLLVNGSIPLDKLNDYARVVQQSRVEIIQWIKDKGEQAIKDELGIK